jgi:subtilase family serine protease
VRQYLKSFIRAAIAGAVVAMGAAPVASIAVPEVPALVKQPIDDANTVALSGNVRPEAIAANDRGPVDDARVLDHILLLLNRPAETDAALAHLIDELHDPKSPQFHAWLTAPQFTAQYGPAASDLHAITDWLSGHGFTINGVHGGNLFVDITGTAAQVRDTFHTEIHVLEVGGVLHIANMTDPRIPAALAAAVSGVVSLHDFRPHTNFKPKYTYTAGGNTYQAVVPGDLATIYNLNPLFKRGISGQGQTVVVIEDTNVYSTGDIASFRKKFGLSSYTSGSFSQEHPKPPSGKNNCTNPGTVAGNEGEATLDAEWAGAAAPSAAIVLAACADTSVTFGGLIALQNLIDGASPPAIVSISYGECEAINGATANAAYVKTYQQAVALGTSVFVSAGDEGAVSCDADQQNAVHGIAVSGFASTPYNVAVGGTDFGDSYAGDNSTYWNTKNSSTYESALSYIPEIPWNDSCASALIYETLGFTSGYGASGACNSSIGEEDFLTTASGSGGPSNCATGKASIPGVVSGTCKGTPKPSWQSVHGNPADGVRDIPDVSLFAANGVWGHYYVYCDSDAADGGTRLYRRAEQLVGSGRHVIFVANLGGRTGTDQPGNGRQTG